MPRSKKKNYKSFKVPTVKLCLGCKEILNRRSDYCIACESKQDDVNTEVERLDDEYKTALIKHKLKG